MKTVHYLAPKWYLKRKKRNIVVYVIYADEMVVCCLLWSCNQNKYPQKSHSWSILCGAKSPLFLLDANVAQYRDILIMYLCHFQGSLFGIRFVIKTTMSHPILPVQWPLFFDIRASPSWINQRFARLKLKSIFCTNWGLHSLGW